ncbi:acetyltransferase [Pyxidicoccus fallax]|uniref:Acetyltransferase n=1 Tax=Pyxidicoccus fallax TaxID=394095 RepID=A0A848LIM7_9BACT|nr:GNAT family N-acetyltransferase [Pyxidicoccus fallax]NMO17572.1 acetyltransferase [Pyxidicoccus fallax]NPC84783.1 acetyltransferase [Pyxidicoccus fallax]
MTAALREDTASIVVPAPPVARVRAPWSIRPASVSQDLERVWRWNQAPHVAAFWKQAWPLERWRAELERQLAGDHSLPCMLEHEGAPVAYLEVYRVIRDRLSGHYAERPHDLGVHVAIGELGHTGRGLGRTLLREVAEGLLAADPHCTRVVAEPDSGNAPSLRAFSAAGFRAVGSINLPDKTATLFVFPRSEEDLP